MTFNDSSSIILIVGAVAILAFVVHGLWFSGRSINRKLVKTSKEDQEIANSSAVGKVRIVMPQTDAASSEIAPQKVESFVHKTDTKKASQDSSPEKIASVPQISNTYELNLYAADGRVYKGLDLEELFGNYGFIRGDKDIYCVYENPTLKDHVVFRICSLESPYSFPKDMSDFSTRSLAIYMHLPNKGKCFIYFKAMRIAANCLIEHLGGVLYDNDNVEMTEEKLDSIERTLKAYDKSED
jgi:FtsZ-interacting cell division protein ZipA